MCAVVCHPQHANAAILELLETVSQSDNAADAATTNPADPVPYAAAPRQPPGRLGGLSLHTAALCGRLSRRRDDSSADGTVYADGGPFSRHRRSEAAENVTRWQAAAKNENGSLAGGLGPRSCEAGLRAGAGRGDGEACPSADGDLDPDPDPELDMRRVLRLVDDICRDLERESPQQGSAPSVLTSDGNDEVCGRAPGTRDISRCGSSTKIVFQSNTCPGRLAPQSRNCLVCTDCKLPDRNTLDNRPCDCQTQVLNPTTTKCTYG